MQKKSLYIDGSCHKNPGPGGWAAICVENGKIKVNCGNSVNPKIKTPKSLKRTTNNAAELLAAILGIQSFKFPCDITIYTDSAYLVSNANHDDSFLVSTSHANYDLWMEYIKARDNGGHKVTFVKVKGHSGNKLNEIADKYAKEQCRMAVNILIKEN